MYGFYMSNILGTSGQAREEDAASVYMCTMSNQSGQEWTRQRALLTVCSMLI
jgi:hypothetical protein